MSWWSSITDTVASLFGVAGGASEPRRQKLRRVAPFPGDGDAYGDADVLVDDEFDGVSPPHTPPRPRKQKKSATEVVASFSREQQDAAIMGMWRAAQAKLERDGRSNFKESEQRELVANVNVAAGLSLDTFDALRKRVERMQHKGTPARAPGSGAKSKFTPEIAGLAKDVSREYGGEISARELFYAVKARSPEADIQERAFVGHIANSGMFKRRRARLKPHLSTGHMSARVCFAEHQLGMTQRKRAHIIFVDEKLFQSFVPCRLLLSKEDVTPRKSAQSKSNLPQCMVLVALMEPRSGFNGILASHVFTESDIAQRKSKNREAGTIVHRNVNVSAVTYRDSFAKSVFPALKQLVDDGVLSNSHSDPFFLQDDNAKPHRGKIDGVPVVDLICRDALRNFQLYLKPLDPLQPAQSPDCNPCDQFFFRCMMAFYRSLRAKDRVYRAQLEHSRAPEAQEDVVGLDSDENDNEIDADDGGDDSGFLHRRQRGVPLCCKPEEPGKIPNCGGCRKPVRERDFDATQCDLRGGWWHQKCAVDKLEEYGHVRGVDPATVAPENPWYCPQCAYHLCRNPSVLAKLCVSCAKPTNRTEDGGQDMVTCDSPFSGLFHKRCVGYDVDDLEEVDDDDWKCPACDFFSVAQEDMDMLDVIEQVPISGNNVAGIQAAIKEAVFAVTDDQMVRGFETRKHFLQAIIDVRGANTYEKHWRGKQNKAQQDK